MNWGLLNEEEYVKNILEMAELGVFVSELSGECIFTNKEWEKISGLSINNSLGRGWLNVVIKEDVPKLYAIINEAAYNNNKITCFEYRIIHPEKGIVYLKASMSLMKVHNHSYFLGSVQDITDLRLAEFKLKATNEKLIMINQDKDRMMKVLVHDLRNPIFGMHIITNELIANHAYSTEMKQMLQLLNSASNSVTEMLTSIMDATLGNHEEAIKKKLANMQQLLEHTVIVSRFSADKKKQNILVKSDKDVFAILDAEKISRVIINLISNAIKFSPIGATITVSMIGSEDKLKISIEDEGIGIPDKISDKIFDMFTESKRYGTENEQPFGLGLSISKQLIEAHGGKIWFQNNEICGTTFFIELPA